MNCCIWHKLMFYFIQSFSLPSCMFNFSSFNFSVVDYLSRLVIQSQYDTGYTTDTGNFRSSTISYRVLHHFWHFWCPCDLIWYSRSNWHSLSELTFDLNQHSRFKLTFSNNYPPTPILHLLPSSSDLHYAQMVERVSWWCSTCSTSDLIMITYIRILSVYFITSLLDHAYLVDTY